MILAAALITASINSEIDLAGLSKRSRAVPATSVICGISTVGYRFVGGGRLTAAHADLALTA